MGGEFNALKQAIQDQSASFNEAKCNVGHINELIQLKYL